jgi:hypothetical protein
MVAAEGFYDMRTHTFSPWGRIHFRAGRHWWAIQPEIAGIKGTFRELLKRLPNALGLSGDNEIELPALHDPQQATEWLARTRKLVRRELGRQAHYAFLFAVLLAVGPAILAAMFFFRGAQRANVFERESVSPMIFIMLAGSIAFAVYGWKRHRFRARVLEQLESVDRGA